MILSKYQNKVEFKNLDDSEILNSDFPGSRTSATSLSSSTFATSLWILPITLVPYLSNTCFNKSTMEKLDFYRHITLHNRQNNLVFWPWESSCSCLIFSISEWKLDLKPSLNNKIKEFNKLLWLYISYFLCSFQKWLRNLFSSRSHLALFVEILQIILLTSSGIIQRIINILQATFQMKQGQEWNPCRCSCKILRQINELSFGIDPTGVL